MHVHPVSVFLEKCAKLREAGCEIVSFSNIVVVKGRWQHHRDPMTAVVLAVDQVPEGTLIEGCGLDEFEHGAAARVLKIDERWWHQIINPCLTPWDPLSMWMLRNLYGNAEQAIQVMRQIVERFHCQVVPQPANLWDRPFVVQT